MLKLIDTHAHLYLDQFAEDREEVIARARAEGVERIYLPNIDRTSIGAMLELEAAYPETCFAMMGLHPCSVGADYREELAEAEAWLARREFCAVGEIGIDLYWDKTYVEEQREAFRIQAGWAKSLGIPIVIHSRESTGMLIDLVAELQDGTLRGVFHCFGGTEEEALRIADLGFFMGIGGVLTFKKSGLPAVLKTVDPRQLVLETDSPYLAPAPFRGKRNESSYVAHVARRLAEVLEMPVEEVARITTENALRLFRKADTLSNERSEK